MAINEIAARQTVNISHLTPEQIERVKASYSRSLFELDFLERFYQIFMDSDDAIREKFRRTDFSTQIHLLRHGLMSAMMFAEGDMMANACIDRIRNSHNHKQLDIRPEYYSLWLSSLIQAVSQCDPDFNEELERDWRAVLFPAIEHIQSGY